VESWKKDGTCWQWLKLPFGQSILGKQRRELVQVPHANLRHQAREGTRKGDPKKMTAQPELFQVNASSRDTLRENQRDLPQRRSLDDMTTEAIKSGFNYELIGRHVIEIAERTNSQLHTLL
jgi:hypothetical protein